MNSAAREPRTSMSDILIVMLVLICGYVGQTLIKSGLGQVGSFQFGAPAQMAGFFVRCARTPQIWVGVMTVGVGFLVWMALLSRLDLSQALPMLAVSYVPWLLIGRYYLGERVSAMRIVGVTLIVIGVLCMGYGNTRAQGPLSSGHASPRDGGPTR